MDFYERNLPICPCRGYCCCHCRWTAPWQWCRRLFRRRWSSFLCQRPNLCRSLITVIQGRRWTAVLPSCQLAAESRHCQESPGREISGRRPTGRLRKKCGKQKIRKASLDMYNYNSRQIRGRVTLHALHNSQCSRNRVGASTQSREKLDSRARTSSTSWRGRIKPLNDFGRILDIPRDIA